MRPPPALALMILPLFAATGCGTPEAGATGAPIAPPVAEKQPKTITVQCD
jgi:hypothetical protein